MKDRFNWNGMKPVDPKLTWTYDAWATPNQDLKERLQAILSERLEAGDEPVLIGKVRELRPYEFEVQVRVGEGSLMVETVEPHELNT